MFGSARTRPDEPAYQQAVAFGRAMAEHDWLVVTGAASGIMEAGHVGAGRENSMGLNIMLPFEQYANPVIAGDPKLVHMKYFFTRKLMFVKECDAVCLLARRLRHARRRAGSAHAAANRQARHGAGRVSRRARRQLLAASFSSIVERRLLGARHDLARGPVALQADRQRRRGGRTRSCSSSASTTACGT